MSADLVNLTIDGVAVSVPKGTTLIEAAKQAGVLVPHYCYHPSLPSPAVCRMCLVEVEKAPKLLPACVTSVAEGQVVKVHSAAAEQAREAVLEFLLINHPLDCPICDQAGECELQDYVFQEGRAGTRYADYAKRYNPVEDFGPDVLYVPNRCILCTRCVRFMEDVAQTPVLNVSERGDRAYIGIDPSQQLDHPWSGNVVDLCPVGSLISKDFLHKARAWDLDKTASICPGCTQGCNMMIDTRDGAVMRLRPRANLEVNRHFMCDVGRADYRWMNRGDRAEVPLQRDGVRMLATDWDNATGRLAALVGGSARVVLLASGRASLESLSWLRRLVEGRPVTAAIKVPLGEEAPLPGIPDLALRKERVPNLDGARLAGYDSSWDAALARVDAEALVIVLDVELDDSEAGRLAAAGVLVALTTLDDERLKGAALLLPVTNLAEENGSYVNRAGRIQRYTQAKSAPGMARPAWWIAGEAWAAGGADRSAPGSAAEAFARLGETIPGLDGASYADLGLTGRVFAGAGAPESCGPMSAEYKGFLLLSIIKMLVVFTIVMIGVALLTLMERKVSAWMQNRRGPNRVGWAGLLQPAADGLKNIIKEETFPASANPLIFTLAPVMAFIPALLLSAVIPWAAPLPVGFDARLPLLGQVSYHGMLSMAVADLPVGFLFVLAISSLGVYGIALAGWSSNNKYSLLGGLRSAAQMVSYEVAMGMSLIPVLLITGNVSFERIVEAQQSGLWFVLPLFLSCFIFLVAGFAETNRLPFDLPEAESELIAGYHTEYSAMKFSMFPISEYANMATVSAMVVTLFFGGWDIPGPWAPAPGGLRTALTGVLMFGKVLFFLFLFMWIRWTLPRFRYDQLMALGWKVMLPLAVLYVMVIALALWSLEHWLAIANLKARMGILFGLNLVLGYLVFYILDRGMILSGSYRRAVPRGAV